MKTKFFFFLLLISIIALQGCSKAECKTDADCLKPHFTSVCLDNKCVNTPIPNECGNGICETGETKCNCEIDCGMCAGISGPFKLSCVGEECVETISESDVEQVVSLSDIYVDNDKFDLITAYNKPFNVLKDTFNIRMPVQTSNPKISDRRITKVALVGKKNRESVPLASKDVYKQVWPGSEVEFDLILNFPTTESSGTFTDLELQVTYEYLLGTIAKKPLMRKIYRGYTLDWIKPSKPYPCPESCDDGNPGTLDVCDESTNFRCEHRPIPNTCGNFICDAAENPCTCPEDCGPCEGDAGTHTTFVCVNNACVAQLKSGVTQESKSLFDDRNLNAFHLQNNYIYKNPLNVNTDKITLEFNLYNKKEDTSDIKITAIRLFDRTLEIASASPDLILSSVGESKSTQLTIPLQHVPESDPSLILKVWYEYTQNSEVKKGSYTKPLGKITLISPGTKK
ncbi:hypothetical protein KY315_00555 [Candidatus Woesearchaeota archaeon]|nr:hypothetical protein [Candidatus Woesearchaeota archaeon]